jgi:hypothetical protein
MPDYERKEIIEAFSAVDGVFISGHRENPEGPREMSVSNELLKIKAIKDNDITYCDK